jgi:hypothetical protein
VKTFDSTIKQLAENSGGEMVVPDFAEMSSIEGLKLLQPFLEKIISQVRSQYVLGFSPSNAGENGVFHQLTVRLANKDRCPTCRIKARRGYYAGVSTSLPLSKKTQAMPSQPGSELDNSIIQRIMDLSGDPFWPNMGEISFELKKAEKIENQDKQSQALFDFLIDARKLAS